MVIFHAGVKENPCVYSNIPSTSEEDAQASVGSQEEDFVPQFKISTWFTTPLFYQVVICHKVFKNGLSEICRRELCPIFFSKSCFSLTLEIFLYHILIYIHDFQVKYFPRFTGQCTILIMPSESC